MAAVSPLTDEDRAAIEAVGGGQSPWRDGWGVSGVITEAPRRDVREATEHAQKALGKDSADQGKRARIVQLASDGDPTATRDLKRLIREVLRRDGYLAVGDRGDDLIEEIFDYLYGFRELAPLVHDPTVDEIQCNTPESIWLERRGRRERSSITLRDTDTLTQYLFQRLFGAKSQALTREQPYLEHVRADGIRLTATTPPRTAFPTLIIRKHSLQFLEPESWVKAGSVSEAILDILSAAVRGRISMLFSGPPGSAKTSLLRLAVGYSDPLMRWVGLATDRELHLREAYPDRNITEFQVGGRGELQDLFRGALRQSPDAVVLEETRNGEEGEIMLQTTRRGHDGSMSTVHVTRAQDVALEVAKLCLSRQALDPTTLTLKWREVGEAFPFIVQMDRDPVGTGRRMVQEIGQHILRGPYDPPEYQTVCRWEPDDPLINYGKGEWRWVNDITDAIRARAVKNGVDLRRFDHLTGMSDRWEGVVP